jgi:hypothetical protein
MARKKKHSKEKTCQGGLCKCVKPEACETCLWAYSPGCLHTLLQTERNAPNMNEKMDVLERFHIFCTRNTGLPVDYESFWDHPETARHVDMDMIRLVFYIVIKIILGKGKHALTSKDQDEVVNFYFKSAFMLYGMIKCGSMAAVLVGSHDEQPSRALDEYVAAVMVGSDDEHRAACEYMHIAHAFSDTCMSTDHNWSGSYGRLLYLLDQLSPCDCLKEEIRSESQTEPELFRCVTTDCEKREEVPDTFRFCSRCKISFYCSPECQKTDWKKGGHKQACLAIQVFFAFCNNEKKESAVDGKA